MIERLRLQERFVGRREERETRTQAGAENPDAIETFGGQPPDRPPGIEDRLAAHLHGAGEVRAHDVVGARELRRHPPIVIRQAEAQRRHAVQRQETAQADVAFGIGVPLREDDHRGSRGSAATKAAAVNSVVLAMRRFKRAWKRQQPFPRGNVFAIWYSVVGSA